MTAAEARHEEHGGARFHLGACLARLSTTSLRLAIALKTGGTLTTGDLRELEARVQSVHEAMALARATRP